MNRRADYPREKLPAIFDLLPEMLADPEFRGCPFLNTSAEVPLAEDQAHRYCAEYYERFHRLIAGFIREYELADPENLAMQLVLLVQGAAVSEQLKRGSGAAAAAKRAARTLLDASFEG